MFDIHLTIKRKAFSLLELIFVIVILGIVSSIGAELIASVYGSYIVQRAQHRSTSKTELASLQIANRLAYAIPDTIIRRVDKTGTPELVTEALVSNADDYNVLQWVGYDADSFTAHDGSGSDAQYPGWSGFCDLNLSTGTNIVSPGSNLDLADTVIENLDGNISNAAIYFPDYTNEHNISSVTDANITLIAAPSIRVEHYKLAWSSYALVVDENRSLYLYHHFTPSPEAAIGSTKSLLLTNVTSFKFRGDGRTLRFKLCQEENIGDDFNITSCKEKAVF